MADNRETQDKAFREFVSEAIGRIEALRDSLSSKDARPEVEPSKTSGGSRILPSDLTEAQRLHCHHLIADGQTPSDVAEWLESEGYDGWQSCKLAYALAVAWLLEFGCISEGEELDVLKNSWVLLDRMDVSHPNFAQAYKLVGYIMTTPTKHSHDENREAVN